MNNDDRHKIPPPVLNRWKKDFDKKSLEERIRYYEDILKELKEQSPHPLHHISNWPAVIHWNKEIIKLRMKKIIRDHGKR